ncbi:ABC transporter ATP-binding protein [Novacetimonas hansenii]|uniref:ABC transporter ATP-binding protein n=1 Tax=Novacetimonas hansenii TaxID=436 RepID=UPI0039E91D33
MKGTVLDVRRVGLRRNGRCVLDDVSLSIMAGRMTGLLGPNGAGKSTLRRVLLGVVRPYAGQVLLDGRDLSQWHRREVAHRIAYVPQGHISLFPYTVRDVVALGRVSYTPFARKVGAEGAAIVADALVRLSIGHLAARSYTDLSGGERQAVLIARALAQGGRILVLDEPETGLDYGQQQRLYALLRELADDGYAIVATTHDPVRAAVAFDHALLLRCGRVMRDGPAAQVLDAQGIARLYARGPDDECTGAASPEEIS